MSDQTREIFGWIAAVVSFTAYLPYIIEYVGGGTKTHPLTRWMWRYLGLRGDTNPHQASWMIWAALQYVIFASSVSQGVSAPAFIVLGYLIGSSTNAILLFWYGEKKWGWVDLGCGTLAIAGLFLLYLTKDAFLALLLAIATDALGAIPTVVGVTKSPKDEGRAGWTMFLIGALVNLLAIKTWNFQEAGYTLYLILVIGYVCLNVWRPRKNEKHSNH